MSVFHQAIKDSYVLVDNGKSEQDMIHIALASDRNYSKYVGVSVLSASQNNPNHPIHFHLFFDDIFDDDVDKIKNLDVLKNGGGAQGQHIPSG